MSDPPSYDQTLLDRLNVLKRSTVQLDPSKQKTPFTEIPKQSTAEIDLSARLRSLRSSCSSTSLALASKSPKPRQSPSPPQPVTEDADPILTSLSSDDKTLDELLAELGPDYQWYPEPDDSDGDIKKLLEEAKEALPHHPPPAKRLEDKNGKEIRPPKGVLTRDLDMSAFAVDDGYAANGAQNRNERLEDESREAQDIVARLLDEVNLELQNESQTEVEYVDASSVRKEGEKDEEGLSLPSAPSTLPESTTEPSKKSLDFESDIAARMAALSCLSTNSLGLPSVPTFKPSDKPVKGVMKKYTDEEVDGWCIICADDATVKCLGCDGDLYCAMCWKEGHMGPDVGFEEKGHKWAKFVQPK